MGYLPYQLVQHFFHQQEDTTNLQSHWHCITCHGFVWLGNDGKEQTVVCMLFMDFMLILPCYFTYVIAYGLTNEVDPKHRIARFMSIFYRYTHSLYRYIYIYITIIWVWDICSFVVKRDNQSDLFFPPQSFTQVDDHPYVTSFQHWIFLNRYTQFFHHLTLVFACKKRTYQPIRATPPNPTGPGAKLYTLH